MVKCHACGSRDYAALAEALNTVLQWLLKVNLKAREAHALIGRRVIALAWTLNPALFDRTPSLTQLARRLRLHPKRLWVLSADISRAFDTRNRGQARYGWNWKKRLATQTQCDVCIYGRQMRREAERHRATSKSRKDR